MGKHKRERTNQLMMNARARYFHEVAENEIEQHNFDKLLRKGIIRPINEHKR
jgi:hypothetical protein